MVPELDLRHLESALRAIVEEFAPPGTTLELVESVQDWAHARGMTEANPFRQAMAFPGHGHIVTLSVLTGDLARSSASILTLGPFAHEALARDLIKYAKYLVLHEVAHLFGMLDEKSADEWALARLNEHLVRTGELPIEP